MYYHAILLFLLAVTLPLALILPLLTLSRGSALRLAVHLPAERVVLIYRVA